MKDRLRYYQFGRGKNRRTTHPEKKDHTNAGGGTEANQNGCSGERKEGGKSSYT